MCAKPEPDVYLQPIGELIREFAENGTTFDYAWVGVATLQGRLENA